MRAHMRSIPLPFDPTDFPCVGIVGSFDELVSTRFSGDVNALCWPRQLRGDFAEIEQRLPEIDGITTLDAEDLLGLKLSPSGKIARDQLIHDQRLLTAQSLQPSLELVPAGEPDLDQGPVRTDVGDWHVDSATVEADTYLCSYYGAATEGVLNADVICQTKIPATRETLRQIYGGNDDAGFASYLTDHFYDLHYAPKPNAQIFSFGLGHLWRIATQYPGSPVLPSVHRAPTTHADQPRRLLLIS